MMSLRRTGGDAVDSGNSFRYRLIAIHWESRAWRERRKRMDDHFLKFTPRQLGFSAGSRSVLACAVGGLVRAE